MSISSIQRKRKTEEFTQALLKKGIEPNNFELNRMLTEYFDNNILGMPFYKPIKQKPYEASSKNDYNHNFITLKEDLDVIYDANIEANNKAVAMQEYYDLEQNKVYNAISKLSLRVENISESLKSTSKSKQYVQVFDDLYGVEFYGNAKRNIPYTTSFIDLLQKKVYTEKTSYKTNKILINNATIEINGLNSFDGYQTEGNINNILSDTFNNIFTIFTKSSNDEGKSITLNIDLGSLIEFNTVSFKFLSVRDMLCELYLSEDGENYISVYDISSRDYVEWRFNSKLVRYIKLVCYKAEPDGFNLSGSNLEANEYYYILKNISIAKEEYETKSVFISKVIDFDDLTSTVKLDATDMIFNNTRIDYFIGFDNGIDKIGWDTIENHKDHELFMFEKRHKILNYHIDSFADEDLTLDLYKLFDLPKNINKNSIKITPAYNMWSVKQYKNKNNSMSFSLATKDFSSYIAECDMTQLFMDCENYTDFKIYPNMLYIMTQFISLEQSMNLFDKFIKITDDNFEAVKNSNEPYIRIFINGYEVIAGDNQQYSFTFRKGVNKIQIALYYSSDDAATNKRLYHNINFKELTNDVFGFVPMQYTNSRTLDNMPADTYQYYTIKNGSIYVKCNPDNMIKSELEDMGYFLSYRCLKEDMIDYFEDNHIKFRIMAVLTSNDKNVSPELINFRITGR